MQWCAVFFSIFVRFGFQKPNKKTKSCFPRTALTGPFPVCRRRGRHSRREPEADSGSDLAPDTALPDLSRSDAGQETDAGLGQRRAAGLQCQQLH